MPVLLGENWGRKQLREAWGTQRAADLLCWLLLKVIRLPGESELWLLPHLLEVVGSQRQCLGVNIPEPQATGFRCHLCPGLFLAGGSFSVALTAWPETWATLALVNLGQIWEVLPSHLWPKQNVKVTQDQGATWEGPGFWC